MASGGLNMTGARSNRRSGRSTRRVACNAAEPDPGNPALELSSCGVCAMLAGMRGSGEGGQVQCALCSAKTTAQWRGADHSKHFPDCPSILYDLLSAGRGTRGSTSDVAVAAAAASVAIARRGSEPEGIGGRGKLRSSEVWGDEVEVGVQEDAGQAISFCETCDGHLLCSRHPMTHTKRKRFQDHSVVQLSKRHPTDGDRCRRTLQPKHDITEFCVSCKNGLCERCQAVGHSSHAAESIASGAVKNRTKLKETLLKCNITTSSSSRCTSDYVIPAADEKLTAMATLQDDITKAKLALDEQAQAASRRITETFDDAQKLLEKKKEKKLHKVDTLLRQSTQPLLEKSQRLSRLKDQYSNALARAQSKEKKAVQIANAVQIAHAVQRNEEKLLTQLQAEKTPVVFAAISATVQSLSELDACLESLVSVGDVEKANVVLADAITVDLETEASARLYEPSNRAVAADLPTPNVKADIGSASGKCQPPLVSKKAAFPDNHTTTHIRGSNLENTSVVSAQGYTTGRHKWSVRVCHGAGDNAFAAGVTVLPRNGDYTGGSWFFDQRRAYFWWCSVGFRSKPDGSAPGVKSAAWQDGDVITFTLDCEGKSLELYLHRTGERHVATDLQCDKPLHPAVNLYQPGQTAEACSVPEKGSALG